MRGGEVLVAVRIRAAGGAVEPPGPGWDDVVRDDEHGLAVFERGESVPFAAPMRVLTISWEYPPVIEGGLARHVRKLSEELVARGVEVHVLTRGGGHLPAREDRHGVIVHRLSEPPFPTDTSAFVRWVGSMNADMRARAGELCETYDFDLVHSHDWLVAAGAERTARRFGLPWVTTVHATEFGRHQGWVQTYPQSRIHAAERGMVRRADHVITVSEFMGRHVASVFGVEPSHVTVIPERDRPIGPGAG